MHPFSALVLLFGACYAMSLVLSETLPVREGLVVVVSLAVASTLVVLAWSERERRRKARAMMHSRPGHAVQPMEHDAAVLLKFALTIELTGFLVILLLHILAVL